jgi:hypothetical protein
MNGHKSRIPTLSKIAAAVAVVAGGAIAFALPAGADVSTQSPPVAAVQVGSPAVLGARGAIVTVPVTYVCAPGSTFGSLTVEVVQRVGGDIARGADGVEIAACTGDLQQVDIIITAYTNPFRKGEAFASARFSICDFTGCRQAIDQRTIEIVR